jgi:hypothetical protein
MNRGFVCLLICLGGIVSNPAVASIECHHQPSDNGSWSWRVIDGQKCWYQGRRVVPKDQLEWPSTKTSHPAQPPAQASWLERPAANAPPAQILFPSMIAGNMLDGYPSLTWHQPWLSPDTIMHWPLLLDVDRVPFTAWTRRIGQ